jgi:hypothetical protein
MSTKARKVKKRKAGPPTGFIVPSLLPKVAPLSDDEFERIADALLLKPEAIANFQGIAAQGFDPGFRTAVDFALISYVNPRLAATSLPSEREVSRELRCIAKRWLKAGDMIAKAAEIAIESPPNPLHVDGVSGARGAAYARIHSTLKGEREPYFQAICGAINSAKAIASESARQALELEESASRRVRHERTDTIAFIANLRAILMSAHVSVALGIDSDADTADETRPFVRMSRLMLRVALDRTNKARDQSVARQEIADSVNLGPLAFVRLLRSAKITRPSRVYPVRLHLAQVMAAQVE